MRREDGHKASPWSVFKQDLGRLWAWWFYRREEVSVEVVRFEVDGERGYCGLHWDGREKLSVEQWGTYGWVVKTQPLWPGRRVVIRGPDGEFVPVVGEVEDGCCTVEEMQSFVRSDVVGWVSEIGVSKMELLFNPLVVALIIGIGGVIAGMLVPSLAEGLTSLMDVLEGGEDAGSDG